jgi:NAD(P)-dependent dehydrogenase (short-subunit alcohol dehydrogenase family)
MTITMSGKAKPGLTAPAGDVRYTLSLRGKSALITGATGHLGSAMAAALAEAGATVVASSRRLADAEAVARQLVSTGVARHHGVALDHADEHAARRGFDAAVAAAGGTLDVLVCNGHDPTAADWRTVTPEQFTRQLANATGYFMLARMMRDHVVARGGTGSIVLLGSMYGTVASYPDAYDGVTPASPVAYHALKGGIIHLTRHLAVYWAKDGVRVNCLSPGPFPSEKAPAEMVERLKVKSPMGRMGHASELKGPIVFLASDAASYVTGHNLIVDGGWTAW